ncbi:MAG: cardiolipin synthase [Chlamydiales bacterium]|jgi:cardiolipin synthase
MYETTLTIFLVVWVLGLSVWIVLERRTLVATVGWIFLLTFLPYVGIPIYLVLGPRKWNRRRRVLARARAAMGGELSSMMERATREVMAALPEEAARLVRISSGLNMAAGARAREVEIFHEGRDFYASLVTAIRTARRHIHLEFYIWRPDRIGTRLRDLLVEKARAGLEVRLLIDGVGSAGFDSKFAQPLRQAGGRVVCFNQPRWSRVRSQRANFRTHRKIVIIDGVTAFTGGMNIADYHSSEFVGALAQRDTHVRIVGMPASLLQLVFLENWHFANGSGPREADYLCLDDEPGQRLVQIAASGPDTEYAPIHKLFLEAVHGARERLYVSSPYFLPDAALVAALQSAALRGVDVRVLVPSQGNYRIVRLASRTYYDELLGCGVKLYEYLPRMLHSKTLVADEGVAILGSANLDNRSFHLNFEVVAVLYDGECARELATRFEADLLEARVVERGEDETQSLPVRFAHSLARLVAPFL